MVGVPVTFEFDDAWNDLIKTAVFKSGNRTMDVVNISDKAAVPWELLTQRSNFYVGVYGVNHDGDLIIPTVWAYVGAVVPGADPSGDEGVDPSLPVWAQMQIEIDNLKQGNGPSYDEDNGQNNRPSQDDNFTPSVTIDPETVVNVVEELPDESGDERVVYLLNDPTDDEDPASGNGQGITADAAALLITILSNGVYSVDQADNIASLAKLLGVGEQGGDDPVEPEVPGVVQTGSDLTITHGVSVAQYGDTILIS
jgi:hypothetical protein